MIITDFKENIKLGGGPCEVGHYLSNQQQCAVLECGVIYFDPEIKKVKTIYVNYFPDVFLHDGVFVRGRITDLMPKIFKIYPRLKTLNKINI